MSTGGLYYGEYASGGATNQPAPIIAPPATRPSEAPPWSTQVGNPYPVDVPHFGWPFQRGANNKVNVVEQGTGQHIMACENFIVRCPLNFRVARPEMGWQSPVFRGLPLDLGALEVALRTWEPRSQANVGQYADVANAAVRNAPVNVPVEGGD